MIQILLLVASAFALAILLNRKSEDILPAYVMVAMLMVYGMAILKISLVAATCVVLGVMAAVILVCVVFVFSGRISKEELKNRLFEKVITIPVIVCAAVCVIFALAMTGHRVVHWDDLSYWGIYAKNLWAIDRLPLAAQNCTISYKDYNPIMQIMEYFFIFGDKSFNEANLFRVNICFMYVLMLPFLGTVSCSLKGCDRKTVAGESVDNADHGKGDRKYNRKYIAGMVVTIVMYVIFPHIFTNQFYYKLGVDYLMSLLFGYGIYLAALDDGDDIFNALRMIVVLSFLADIKTTGAVLSLFVALFYAVFRFKAADKSKKLSGISGFIANLAVMSAFPLGVYFSWKLWGRRTGNHGYLSDRMEDSVSTLKHIFPDYTKDTVINYIKHVFTYPLTREKVGITAAGIIALCVIIYYIRKYAGKITPAHKHLHIVMMTGLVIFCMAHLYMYLFVFDDWEAAGLLEFDRYINQYLAGVFFYYLYKLWQDGSDFVSAYKAKYSNSADTADTAEAGNTGVKIMKNVNPAIIIVIVLALLLPYRVMWRDLIPSNYAADYETGYKVSSDSAFSEWERSPLKAANLPKDEEHRVMLMGDAWSDELQFLTMAMVPQPITVVENVPALLGEGLDGFARDLINANGIDYVYVMEKAPEGYEGGDFDKDSSNLTVDGSPIEGGSLYQVVKENDEIMLKICH